MRGLKCFNYIQQHAYEKVALYTSAWIEIAVRFPVCKMLTVALYTSAWIEIVNARWLALFAKVALYTSAWIEIQLAHIKPDTSISRTLHECVD